MGRRPQVPSPGSPAEVPTRRSWGRAAAAVVAILAGVWLTNVLVAEAGERVELLAVAEDVAKGDRIGRDDIQVVRVAADPEVATVPAGDLDDIVGTTAGTDLTAGSLLSPDHMLDEGDRVVSADEAVVGAKLGPGGAPWGEVAPGTPVIIVIRPDSSARDGEIEQVRGWLRDIGAAHENTGEREASLVVPSGSASTVAAASAAGRIAIVTLEEAG